MSTFFSQKKKNDLIKEFFEMLTKTMKKVVSLTLKNRNKNKNKYKDWNSSKVCSFFSLKKKNKIFLKETKPKQNQNKNKIKTK